jgi:ketosteroid isomerase-like protein
MSPQRGITLLFILAACTTPASTSRLSDQDRTALQAIADQDAGLVTARAWDSLAAMYEEAAVRLPPNTTALTGRTAIRSAFDDMPPLESFTFRMISVVGDEHHPYKHGAYTIALTPPGAAAPINDTGKILVVFRKQPSGEWRRVADAWSSNAAAP